MDELVVFVHVTVASGETIDVLMVVMAVSVFVLVGVLDVLVAMCVLVG